MTMDVNQTIDESHSSPYAINAAQVIVIIAIVTTNTLTLVAIATTSRLQTIANTYIASLAVSDLLVSVNKAVGIFWVHSRFRVTFEENSSLCMFFKCLVQMTELSSLSTIILIAADRFLYIKFPFYYLRVVTKFKVKLFILLAWVLSVAFTLIVRMVPINGYPGCGAHALLYGSDETGYIHGALFLLICAALFVLYGVVLRTAAQQAKAIRHSQQVGVIAVITTTEPETATTEIISNTHKTLLNSFSLDETPLTSDRMPLSSIKTPLSSNEMSLSSPASVTTATKHFTEPAAACTMLLTPSSATTTTTTTSTAVEEKSRPSSTASSASLSASENTVLISCKASGTLFTNCTSQTCFKLPDADTMKYPADGNHMFTNTNLRLQPLSLADESPRNVASESNVTHLRSQQPVLHAGLTSQTMTFTSPITSHLVTLNSVTDATITPTTTLTSPTATLTSQTERIHKDENSAKARRKLRAVKLMAGVFAMLFVCWSPYAVIGLIGPTKVSPAVVLMAAFFASFNSAANFGVYALGDRVFRAAIARLLGCQRVSRAGKNIRLNTAEYSQSSTTRLKMEAARSVQWGINRSQYGAGFRGIYASLLKNFRDSTALAQDSVHQGLRGLSVTRAELR